MLPDTQPNDEIVNERFRKRYARQEALFRFWNAVLAFVGHAGKSKPAVPAQPRRILVANAGHLGDAIITSALFPVLRHAYPGAEIDVLTGSLAASAFHRHPLLGHVFILDHWYLSRSSQPVWRRVWRYIRDYFRTLSILKQRRYDIAIDVRAWFPNFISLLWLAGIPIRAGYDRVGFGPALTHRLSYVPSRRHELDYQLDLLRLLGIEKSMLDHARPNIAPPGKTARDQARALVDGRYRILHPASSTPTRDWPLAHWTALAGGLVKRGITPVITGRGARDQAIAQAIAAAVPGTVNSCDRASWDCLIALIENAECVYSVETSIGHIASALGKPVIAIYGGMADPRHWQPLGAICVTNSLPCSPCFQKDGCATRECLTGISVAAVERAAALATGS